MCDFINTEWPDLPPETTVNDIMRRWNHVVEKNCTCGGRDYDDRKACAWCRAWHFVIGRLDSPFIKQAHGFTIIDKSYSTCPGL
jgi:hypothetical protein